MKKIISLLLSFFFCLTITACDKKEPQADKQTVKIGAILPLIGDYRTEGEIAKQALLMFKQNLQEQNFKYNYEFVIEPADVINMKSVAAAARKVISVDNVDAVISYWNNPGIVVSEITKDKSVAHLNLGNDLKTAKTRNNFNFSPNAENQVHRSLTYMQKQGIKTLAIVGCNNQWSADLQTWYKKLAPEYGITITGIESVNIGTKDFNFVFEKLRVSNPNLYTLILESPEYEIARKKMLEKNISTPVTTIEMSDYTNLPQLFEGSWYVCNPEGKPLFLRNFKKFSGLNKTNNAAYIYDIASVLVQAFEQAPDKSGTIEALQNIHNFNGITGNVRQDNNFFKTTDVIKEIKNGKPRLLEE